jgi:uncharacterized heparinase superfamily protein
MSHWLKVISHPDGQFALFNDAAFDIAPSPKELERYAQRLRLYQDFRSCQNLESLLDSGYLRLQQGSAVIFLDIGVLGPDYLPGHAHADTLSFEWSVFNQRVLVNSGTSCYSLGAERLRQRSTPAHNTVVVNQQNSSEVWGSFRVAQRAKPFGLKVETDANLIKVTCAHDGFRRLPGKPIHWREWLFQSQELIIHDRLEGKFEEAVARFHFHPTIMLRPASEEIGVAQLLSGEPITWEIVGGVGHLESSTYHPQFGMSVPNQCLTVKFSQAEVKVIFRW